MINNYQLRKFLYVKVVDMIQMQKKSLICLLDVFNSRQYILTVLVYAWNKNNDNVYFNTK